MFIIYKTTNLINGKFYIGVHRIDAKQSHKEYFGSDQLITSALNKYGRDKFKRETLFTFDNLEEALKKENELVNEEFIKDENNYNLTVGGSMPPNAKYWWTKEHSEKARLRLLNNSYKLGVKESEESKRKKSISMKKSAVQGRWQRTKKHCEQIAERAKKQLLETNPMKSEILRKKVSQSKIGRRKMINSEGIQKYVRPEEFDKHLNEGFVFKSFMPQHMNYTINAIDNP